MLSNPMAIGVTHHIIVRLFFLLLLGSFPCRRGSSAAAAGAGSDDKRIRVAKDSLAYSAIKRQYILHERCEDSEETEEIHQKKVINSLVSVTFRIFSVSYFKSRKIRPKQR